MGKKAMEKRLPEEVWLTVEQAARVLEVPWPTVRGWAHAGDPRLPAYKVWEEGEGHNGRFRFKKGDVEACRALLQAGGDVGNAG